jgi:hypothetical protein
VNELKTSTKIGFDALKGCENEIPIGVNASQDCEKAIVKSFSENYPIRERDCSFLSM